MIIVYAIMLLLVVLITPAQFTMGELDIAGEKRSVVALIPVVNKLYVAFKCKRFEQLVSVLTLMPIVYLTFIFKGEFTITHYIVLFAAVLIDYVMWCISAWNILTYGKLPYESTAKYIIYMLIFPLGVSYAFTYNKAKLRAEQRRREILKL